MTDKRSQALKLLREYAAERIIEVGVAAAHRELMTTTRAILDDLRQQHDIAGVRYWESYDVVTLSRYGRTHHTTFVKPFDDLTPPDTVTVELTRLEFFARQDALAGYKDML